MTLLGGGVPALSSQPCRQSGNLVGRRFRGRQMSERLADIAEAVGREHRVQACGTPRRRGLADRRPGRQRADHPPRQSVGGMARLAFQLNAVVVGPPGAGVVKALAYGFHWQGLRLSSMCSRTSSTAFPEAPSPRSCKHPKAPQAQAARRLDPGASKQVRGIRGKAEASFPGSSMARLTSCSAAANRPPSTSSSMGRELPEAPNGEPGGTRDQARADGTVAPGCLLARSQEIGGLVPAGPLLQKSLHFCAAVACRPASISARASAISRVSAVNPRGPDDREQSRDDNCQQSDHAPSSQTPLIPGSSPTLTGHARRRQPVSPATSARWQLVRPLRALTAPQSTAMMHPHPRIFHSRWADCRCCA